MSGYPDRNIPDDISEYIITALSMISGLFVIALNSSFTFKERRSRGRGRQEARRALHFGRQRAESRQSRGITAQLVDAGSGGHIWAERFDRELTDVFAVQDEVTKEIVAALALNLSIGEQQQLAGEHTSSPEAYDCFLRGRELWHLQTRRRTPRRGWRSTRN